MPLPIFLTHKIKIPSTMHPTRGLALLAVVLLAAVVASNAQADMSQHDALSDEDAEDLSAALIPWGGGKRADVVQRCGRHFCLGDVRFAFVGTYVVQPHALPAVKRLVNLCLYERTVPFPRRVRYHGTSIVRTHAGVITIRVGLM